MPETEIEYVNETQKTEKRGRRKVFAALDDAPSPCYNHKRLKEYHKWKHSSAGMSVRLTRERSGVRASLLPFLLPFFNFPVNIWCKSAEIMLEWY